MMPRSFQVERLNTEEHWTETGTFEGMHFDPSQ